MTNARLLPEFVGPIQSSVASAAFVLVVATAALWFDQLTIAVYALSFCHYGIYALACTFAAVPLSVFKRDAIIMKGIALCILMAVYLPGLTSFPSIAVVACGFLLNATGAAALGSDRTYYGHEIAGLPLKRITSFPYSLMRHPMLIGNIVAFGGTLIDPAFRRDWWALGAIHVALNVALLAMETRLTPSLRRRVARVDKGCRSHHPVVVNVLFMVVGATVAALLSMIVARSSIAISTIVGGSVAAYALTLHGCYRAPRGGSASTGHTGDVV